MIFDQGHIAQSILALMLTLLPDFAMGQQTTFHYDSDFPFVVVTKDTVRTAPRFTDEMFYSYSAGVVFEVNKSVIPDDDNFRNIYRNQVLPMVNRRHLQLRKVYIRGAASPEGSYAGNQRLGRARSEALLDMLRQDLQHQYLTLDAEVSAVTEDYPYLCLLMKENGDADYEFVNNIVIQNNANESRCKNALMRAKGGKLWKRLLAEYFPRLRSARLILWFSEPDKIHAPIEMPQVVGQLSTLPDTKFDIPELHYHYQFEAEPVQRRHLIAARTNLLHDFLYVPKVGFVPSPNIQFEFYPLTGHYTYNIGFTWGNHRNYGNHKFFQMRDLQFEVRRYFKGGGKFMGAYLGAFAEGNIYGIGYSKEKGWEGEGAGAGLTVGYVLPLNKRKNLRLEFMLAAGFYATKHDPYVYGNPLNGSEDGKYYYDYMGNASDFRKRNHFTTWLGPTNAGIQITYDIIYRKRKVQKGGAQ